MGLLSNQLSLLVLVADFDEFLTFFSILCFIYFEVLHAFEPFSPISMFFAVLKEQGGNPKLSNSAFPRFYPFRIDYLHK